MKVPYRQIMLLTALAALGVLGAVFVLAPRTADREALFVVPPGTVARLAAGEKIQILPQTVELVLGERDVLIIRNEDTQSIVVGPFKIAPGQQFRQQYRNAGIFDLMCTLHESERLRVLVRRPGEAER